MKPPTESQTKALTNALDLMFTDLSLAAELSIDSS